MTDERQRGSHEIVQSRATCVVASAGYVKDARHADLIKKFLQLNIQTP
jgi:hypothetical protein